MRVQQQHVVTLNDRQMWNYGTRSAVGANQRVGSGVNARAARAVWWTYGEERAARAERPRDWLVEVGEQAEHPHLLVDKAPQEHQPALRAQRIAASGKW